MSQLLGITRERVFSPGRVDDDRAIIEEITTRLRGLGHAVSLFDADSSPWPRPARGTVVFAMCQGREALRHLQHWQEQGVRVINSAQGILNCRRHRTIAALRGGRVAFPESLLLDTSAELTPPPWLAVDGAWVKRGDVHATEPDDVIFVDGGVALQNALGRFGDRRTILPLRPADRRLYACRRCTASSRCTRADRRTDPRGGNLRRRLRLRRVGRTHPN